MSIGKAEDHNDKMLSRSVALLLAVSSTIVGAAKSPYPPFSGNMFKKYNLEAEGIKASFIPYGARLTNLYVKDRDGAWQDVAIGYDEGRQYLNDSETVHTYFGAVVGRYANRYVEMSCSNPTSLLNLDSLQNQERHFQHQWSRNISHS